MSEKHLTVGRLVELLTALPADAKVSLNWDGAARSRAEFAWLAQSGEVLISDGEQPVYYDRDRPADAVSDKEAPYVTVEELLARRT